MKEIWKNVKGYEGYYQVSNLGRVKSFYLDKKDGRLMKKRLDRYGYEIVKLRKNKKQKSHTLHRLIAIAFIPNCENKREVNHINGIKNDNKIENLEWVTPKENVRHYLKHLGGYEKIRKTNVFKTKKIFMYSKSGKLLKTFESQKKASEWLRNNGFPRATQSNISMCKNGYIKQAYGYIWKNE